MELGINGGLTGTHCRQTANRKTQQAVAAEWIASLAAAAEEDKAGDVTDSGAKPAWKVDTTQSVEGTQESGGGRDRSEAVKIFEAAAAGKENPINQLNKVSKVPYGYLAKDGVIEYNGVIFVCDEKTNSICLGDVSDPKQVINVALSGGGNLKLNRNNIGDLSKAAGMFSPRDLNLIMRAIAQDTKIQSMKKELDDMENSIGNEADTQEQNAEE